MRRIFLVLVWLVLVPLATAADGGCYTLDLEYGPLYPYIRRDTGQVLYDKYYLTEGSVQIAVSRWNWDFYGRTSFVVSMDDSNDDAGDVAKFWTGTSHVFAYRGNVEKDMGNGVTRGYIGRVSFMELDISCFRENRVDLGDNLNDYNGLSLRLAYMTPPVHWWPEPYMEVTGFQAVHRDRKEDDGISYRLGIQWGNYCKFDEISQQAIGNLHFGVDMYMVGNNGVFGFDNEPVRAVGLEGDLDLSRKGDFWKLNFRLGYQWGLDPEANSIAKDHQAYLGLSLSCTLPFG